MADIQKYFEDFHDTIKLDDENKTLREKRDIILNKLRSGLKKMFEDKGETPPIFTHFNKGSYAMNLGTVPLEGDYDIDVGLEFDITKEDYPDPVVIKQWVCDALYGHTNNVKIKQPCVTVQYQINQEPVYHVDFAVYSPDGTGSDNLFLARGKLYSASEFRIWEPDDPKGLMEKVRNKFQEDDRKQFRRVIRYLKRWKDVQFPSEGNAAPIGIGITVAGYYWFSAQKILIDFIANKYKFDDLKALHLFVSQMINNFKFVYHSNEQAERLTVNLPVQSYCDLFNKMTNKQMEDFKEKLETLRDALEEAEQAVDPVSSCEILSSQFGEDFPVPESSETASTKGPAIISSSSSA